MLTVHDILPPGHWDETTAADSIALDHDERHRRRFRYTAQAGTRFLLDLARPTVLEDGAGLRLSDGRTVLVRAAPEALMEVRAADAHSLLRLAWHLGNRHLPTQIMADGLRLRHDHVIRDMLEGLGAEVRDISAPFSPEQGAYAGGHAGHGHSHEAAHDHGHGHHDHHEHGHHSHAG